MTRHFSASIVGAVAIGALFVGRQDLRPPKGRFAVIEKHHARAPDELDAIALESAHYWIALRRKDPAKVREDAKKILPRIRALLQHADLDFEALQALQCIEVSLTGEGEITRLLDTYQDTPSGEERARTWARIRQVCSMPEGPHQPEEKEDR